MTLTREEVRDIAYQIATTSVTLQTCDFQQWQEIDTQDVLWEPLDNLGTDFTEDLVCTIADNVEKYLANIAIVKGWSFEKVK